MSYLWSQFPFYEATPCLLPPKLHKGQQRVRSSKDADARIENWTLLPFVTSTAIFTILKAEDADPPLSVAVIWYQDAFGMPGEEVLAQMRAIDWRKHAQAWDW